MSLHALFIGINDYKSDLSISNLRYAQSDARELYGLFRNGLGHNPQNIHILDAPNNTQAMDKLRGIGSGMRSGDSFLFFFSGHGHQIRGDQYLLMPSAVRADILADRRSIDVLSLKDMIEETQGWPNVQSVFLLDACRTDLRKPKGAKDSETADPNYSPQTQAALIGAVSRSPVGSYGNYGGQATDADSGGFNGKATSPPAIAVYGSNAGQICIELETLQSGLSTRSIADWIREGVTTGKPRVLGKCAEPEINHHMAQNAHVFARGNPDALAQKIWVNAETEVVLYKPELRRDERPTLQLKELLADFERQLSDGQLQAPLMDCCQSTLARLGQAGLPKLSLDAHTARLEAAIVAAKEAQDADDEAFEQVQKEKTYAACMAYFANFPNGSYRQLVSFLKIYIEDRAFQDAKLSGTALAYESYLRDYPQSSHEGEALQLASCSTVNGPVNRAIRDSTGVSAFDRNTKFGDEKSPSKLNFRDSWGIYLRDLCGHTFLMFFFFTFLFTALCKGLEKIFGSLPILNEVFWPIEVLLGVVALWFGHGITVEKLELGRQQAEKH